MTKNELLNPVFFARSSPEVAKALLGRYLKKSGNLYLITETAAFEGIAKTGKPKFEYLAMEPGAIYPHHSYGGCTLAISTEAEGIASVVTITEAEINGEIVKSRAIAKGLGLTKDNLGDVVNVDSGFQLLKDQIEIEGIKEYLPSKSPTNLKMRYKLQR